MIKDFIKSYHLYLLKIIFFISIAGLTFISCKNEDDVVAFLTSDAENELKMIMAFDDVEYITYEGMELSNNIMEGRTLHDEGPLGAACVSVSFNNQQNSTTIDFGEGCEGPGKIIRKGKIIITQTGKYFEPGTIITATSEKYTVNNVLVEGRIIIINTSGERTMKPSFSIKSENGKVIFSDEEFATRELDYVRVWNRSTNVAENQYYVSGSATGSFRNGTTYISEIQNDLNYKRECLETNFFLPVQGVVSLKLNEIDAYLLNYGNGTCDNKVSISSEENSKEVNF